MLDIQDFMELNEAFNSEPYEATHNTSDPWRERYTFKEDENHNYRVEIAAANKLGLPPFGAKTRVVRIGFNTNNSAVYKPIVTKFKDPKKVISTILGIINNYKTDGLKGSQVQGFAIMIDPKILGSYGKTFKRIARMYLRQQFNVSESDYTPVEDNHFVWIVRKGKNFADVFNGSGITQDVGQANIESTPETKEVTPTVSTDQPTQKPLKFDVGDFIYSEKLNTNKYYYISGITFSHNETYYEVSQIAIGNDHTKIELNTRIKAKIADANFELYIPQKGKTIVPKFKVGQSIARPKDDFYSYITNIALGDDPVYYCNVYSKETNELKYADTVRPVEIVDDPYQEYKLYTPDSFVKPGTWLKFNQDPAELGKGDDLYMLILSYVDGEYTANIYDKYGYITKSNYDPSATEVSSMEVLTAKPEFAVEPFNSGAPKWSKGDNVATPLSSVFVAISAIKNGQYEATLLNKSDISVHTPMALYPFITFDDPGFEPYEWKKAAETKFKAGQYIARPDAPNYAQIMEVYTADDGKVYYVVDKYGKEDNMPKESPGINYEVDMIDKADPPFSLYTPVGTTTPHHVKGYSVGDEVYISKSAVSPELISGAGKTGEITIIQGGDIMVSTDDGNSYVFDQNNIQWLKKNTKVAPATPTKTPAGFDVKPASSSLPKVSRQSKVMGLPQTQDLIKEISEVIDAVSGSKEALNGLVKVSFTHSNFMDLLSNAKKLEDLLGTSEFESLATNVYKSFETVRNAATDIKSYEYMPGLTGNMRNNITYYTGSGYNSMNKDLRKGKTSDEIQSVDEAFYKTGLNLKGVTVYRGQKTETQALISLEAGNMLCFPTYTSTSLRLDVAFSFANTEMNTKGAILKAKSELGGFKLSSSGRAKAVFQIENIDRVLSIPVLGSSDHSSEAEIILHRNTYVKLTSPKSYIDFEGGRFYQVTVVEESMLTEQEKKASIIMSFEEFLNESEKSEMKQDFDDAVTKIQVLAAASRPATDVSPRENWTDDAFVMVNSDKPFKVYDDLNYLVGAFDNDAEAQEFASQRANHRVVNASL